MVHNKFFERYHKTGIILLATVSSIFVLTRCMNDARNKSGPINNDNFKKYAGSTACAECHKEIYEKHLHTEHHLTSAPSTENNILGSFEPGKNVFAFDPTTNVTMEKRDSGFYQVEYVNGAEVRKGKFDIVVGSGRKGQSYLNWVNNRLVQLPITYFSPAAQWSNSPGYNPHKVMFYRPITSRCLECHSTYFEKISDPSKQLEEFDHTKIIYAVDCEKCHGPSAAHVEFHTKNPAVKEARFVVNPGKLPRQRLLDLCALCHGGSLKKIKASFEFQAGDTISNYFTFNPTNPNIANIDVHGNQLGLLSLSKCFISSNLTCISCHNTHENENGKIQVFSQRCMACHSDGHGKSCKMTSSIGPSITQNCIDCHMPKQPSHAVAVYLQGADAPTPALMRTHYITIYPGETQKVLSLMKKSKSISSIKKD
ncbi:MAG TPA: multiheme c-type cytochrome [Chitinophagaceae bacterium]|nr:multiheme c-type cytochrome [Chitinophagaceae bacterium]